MSIVLALLSAAAFGVGDFFGGLATRRSGPAATIVLFSHITGLAMLAALVPLFGTDALASEVLWGVLGGMAGAVGLVLLYRGLAMGQMSIVAPITALGAALVPVTYGLVTGERPTGWDYVGAIVVLVAIGLIARADDGVPGSAGISAWQRWRAGGLVAAVGSGIGFGVFFIFIAETSTESGLIPLVAARVSSVSVLALVAVGMRRRLRLERPALVLTAGAGVFDAAANALFLAAARIGLLSLVSVLGSLYPAATILLARTVLGERIGRVQQAGLAAGLVGVVLITLG